MRRLRKEKGIMRHSVFVMVLILFFAITIPIYIIGFGVYHWGYMTLEREITAGLRSNLHYYMNEIEAELLRIRTLQYECLNDEDLFYTVNAEMIMTPYEKARALLTMQHRLGVVRQSSSYIADVRVYLPATGRMISAASGVDRLTDEWKPILYSKADGAPSALTYYEGDLYLCASYPIISPQEDAIPLYTMIISLDTDEIRALLKSCNPSPEGGAALYARGRDYLLSSDARGEMARALISNDQKADKAVYFSAEGEDYLAVSAASAYLGMEFYSYVSQASIFSGLWYYRTLFYIFSAVMLLVAVFFAAGSYYLIHKPMKTLIRSLKRVEQGDLRVRIRHELKDEYAYLYDTFNSMAEALQNLIEMNYKQKLLTQQAQMKQLQTQINPHFLYNSFFTLYRMAKDEDIENLTQLLTYLSDYYRFITRNASAEVPLRDEVRHAENYANIQRMRFTRRIRVEMEPLPQEAQGLRVPRLILQPVLENAFEHGLKDVSGGGLLRVSYRLTDGRLYIDVENNGETPDQARLDTLRAALSDESGQYETTGLVNIHKRLNIKFGAECGLTLRAREGGGLTVTLALRLPWEDRHVPYTGG